MKTIYSSRLCLRELTLDDADFMLTLLNDAAFIANIGDRGVRDLDAARRYLTEKNMKLYAEGPFGMWAVCLRDGEEMKSEVMGVISLFQREYLDAPDIGYAFLPQYRGQGYAREATQAAYMHAREQLGMQDIVAILAPGNQRSIAVLAHLGMRYEREIAVPPEGEILHLYRSGCGGSSSQ